MAIAMAVLKLYQGVECSKVPSSNIFEEASIYFFSTVRTVDIRFQVEISMQKFNELL